MEKSQRRHRVSGASSLCQLMNQNRFPAPADWKGREHWVGVCGLFITLPLLVNDFYCSANGTPSSRPGFTRKPALGKLYQDRMSPWHASIAHSCLREPRKLKPSCSSLRPRLKGPPGLLHLLQTSASRKPGDKRCQGPFQALHSTDQSSESNMALKHLPWPRCLGIKAHLGASTTTLNPHTGGHQPFPKDTRIFQNSQALCSQPVHSMLRLTL